MILNSIINLEFEIGGFKRSQIDVSDSNSNLVANVNSFLDKRRLLIDHCGKKLTKLKDEKEKCNEIKILLESVIDH